MLKCEHILTLDSLDGIMFLKEYYIKEEDEYVSTQDLLDVEFRYEYPTCPLCREGITGFNRYKRTMNKIFLDNLDKKYIQKVRETISYASNFNPNETNPKLNSLFRSLDGLLKQPTEELYQNLPRETSMIARPFIRPKVELLWKKAEIMNSLIRVSGSEKETDALIRETLKIFRTGVEFSSENTQVKNITQYKMVRFLIETTRYHFEKYRRSDKNFY